MYYLFLQVIMFILCGNENVFIQKFRLLLERSLKFFEEVEIEYTQVEIITIPNIDGRLSKHSARLLNYLW